MKALTDGDNGTVHQHEEQTADEARQQRNHGNSLGEKCEVNFHQSRSN